VCARTGDTCVSPHLYLLLLVGCCLASLFLCVCSFLPQFSLESKRFPTITDAGLKRRRARDLGTAEVTFLRALHVHTQAALFAMMEFRARKPRT
jgi:uncharacterized metal-binding protein